MDIRAGRPQEAAELTELILRSKAHWGYDAAFLARCRPALTLHEDQVEPHRTLVAELDGRVAGVVTVTGVPPEGEIDLLFIDPWAIGHGVGRALVGHATAAAAAEGFESLLIESDPQAEPFYLRMGAVRIGEQVSPATGRALPLLRLGVSAPILDR
ncbi:MAG: GNAT family N-acetyltransferase [Hamadaea sp.]|uniref:GNAT family N-acetyltransferase n=1 Tax=Hamadaea sp. TaxID=2024425 RepID=UPI00184B129E|nr:GNAT family N-acetyltransferase [Hamadaea sp.]NUR74349.1 GNAT family N-acetyltransferase [Hamadaea sp.]NUT20994.1 GNAT family N-acetyltransferase [Hamadaea sp.]